MKFSLVIPVLKSYGVVDRQIRYWKSLNFPDDIEIILMDDGSIPPLKDSIRESCKNLSIYPTNDFRPWTQPCAKNAGAKIAKGEFLFITDIDHIIPKEAFDLVYSFDGDKVEFRRRRIAALTQAGKFTCNLRYLRRYGLTTEYYKTKGLVMPRHLNTFAMRRSVFLAIGGYPHKLCDLGVHNINDEGYLLKRYNAYMRAGKCKSAVDGGMVYVFPNSGKNPVMFHDLFYE